MADRLVLDLFCEDAGHEVFARALVHRLARECGAPSPTLSARSTRGGHGRALTELRSWQRTLGDSNVPGDGLVVLIDANGAGWNTMRSEVLAAIDTSRFARVVVGCPDPHVEAWCAADPSALGHLLGTPPPARPTSPGRHAYKRWLREALESAGELVLNDPMDIAYELVPMVDLYRAGRADPSLRSLCDGLRDALRPASPPAR